MALLILIVTVKQYYFLSIVIASMQSQNIKSHHIHNKIMEIVFWKLMN